MRTFAEVSLLIWFRWEIIMIF